MLQYHRALESVLKKINYLSEAQNILASKASPFYEIFDYVEEIKQKYLHDLIADDVIIMSLDSFDDDYEPNKIDINLRRMIILNHLVYDVAIRGDFSKLQYLIDKQMQVDEDLVRHVMMGANNEQQMNLKSYIDKIALQKAVKKENQQKQKRKM